MKKTIIVSLLLLAMLICLCGCGHEHSMVQTVLKDATCTDNGIIKNYCESCDYSYEETVESLGHDYDDGTVVVEKTCTTDGKKEYICKRCNDKKDEVIPASHDFKEEIVSEATCLSVGKKVKTCSICGYSESEEIEKKEHSFDSGICIYCNAVKVDTKDLKPDTWYQNKSISGFYVSNCIATNATTTYGAVIVSYYPVCSECHLASSNISGAFVQWKNGLMSNTYKCEYCGLLTLVCFEYTDKSINELYKF